MHARRLSMMEPSSEVAAGGNRRSIRLKNRDYALRDQYFVTICARERSCVFGSVADGTLVPAALGRLVRECWVAIPQHFPVVTLDEFVIMPNHLHGVITLTPHEGRSTAAHLQKHKARRGRRTVTRERYLET